MIKSNQQEVNETLKHIKSKYPEANDNGLSANICAKSETPLNYMNNADFLDQVNRSRIWINWAKSFGLRKSINRKHSSYGIKHLIEKDEMSKGYVCNMAAIVALIIEGVKITSHGNPLTNLSNKPFMLKVRREARRRFI